MVASIVTILFLLIFGEVVPKHFGVTFTTLWMKAVSYPLWLVVRLLKPVTRAMDLFSRLMMNLLPFKGEDGDSVSIQELLIMARYSAKSGHIDEIERKLVVRATRFNDLEAKDVMIPRRQVFAVPETIGIDELRHEFNEHLLSRIPVYHETIDNVVGIFNFKELIKFKGRPDSFNILSFCHEPLYVPEKVSIGSLFEQMRVKQSHMAIIVDEFGATQGIITLEDIIERIFGLIHDEYDEEAVQPIVRISDTEFEVRGRASLDELAVAVGVRFPEEVTRKVDTVNGLITLLKGDFPEYRDEFEFQNLVFSVEKSQGMRASKVRIKLKH
jgi:putative hemolysin